MEKTFQSYVSNYDHGDRKVKLKVDHTYKVAQLCDEIGALLELSSSDRDLVWLLGMLHDIGRFEQLRRYHTFKDRDSIDHACLSAEILFAEGWISQFVEDEREYPLIETAIRFHNRLELPSMNQNAYVCSTILRDADKIDILRINCKTPRSDIYGIPEEEFFTSAVSDAVLEDLQRERTVDRKHVKTAIDFLLGHISFVFGLVYPCSIQIMRRQRYLDKMLAFESRNTDTQKKMNDIRSWIHAYLKREGY